MISIEIPRRDDAPESFDIESIPSALLNAVNETRRAYPDIDNNNGVKKFDRLFENLYNCYIEYDSKNFNAVRVVWPDERNYTVFLLKWA